MSAAAVGWLGCVAVLAVLVALCVPSAPATGSAAERAHWHDPSTSGPYFDPTVSNNVTVIAGRTAQLHCRILQLGQQTVSWIRKRDLHILTLGEYSYTTDDRFKVLYEPEINDYTLHITEAITKDAGVYECQVNTEPKLSWPVTLGVQVASAELPGPAELYVKLDSNINLNCRLRAPADPPVSLTWLHNGAELDLAAPRAGISLSAQLTPQGSTSFLVITRARLQDSGNYTCRPSEGRPAGVRVHVINDDTPAAMQTASCPPRLGSGALMTALLLAVLCRLSR